MILYEGTAKEYSEAVDTNKLIEQLELAFKQKLGRKLPPNEVGAYNNSLSFMERVIRRSGVSDDCAILIEYIIPLTSNRIDFLIAGEDDFGNKNFVIVELKQWQKASPTESDAVVRTFLNGGDRETTHPSYQANSYKLFLSDFNEEISSGKIKASACAYLHNYHKHFPEPLENYPYDEIIKEAPIYFSEDQEKLEKFIAKNVKYGKGKEILYAIEHGEIKPTKKLIDYVSDLFIGNNKFIFLDNQKVAFEKARSAVKDSNKKTVVIVQGGPGTGKSVISVNLLGQFLKDKLNTLFVAPNASFRNVLIKTLAREFPSNRLQNLFKGSSSFVDTDPNTYDVLIIDEAHRLKDRRAYMYTGKNQVEDVIKAARTTIFFIDDDQVIRPEDIGSVKEINRIAHEYEAEVYTIELESQFRCAGADGYINWLNDVWQLKMTANYDGWEEKDFEFRIFDDPNEMRKAIKSKHEQNYDARILAGYAWSWTSGEKGNADAQIEDVQIPEFEFSMPWNSRKVGTTWSVDQEGIDQVGCIHTSQGIDFDYVGVIVGKDITFNQNLLEFSTEYNAYKDFQGKLGLKEKPEELNLLVRRIYKILMSRPRYGCYVYFCDPALKEYFQRRLTGSIRR